MRRSNGASEATGMIRAIYNGPVTVLLIITGLEDLNPLPVSQGAGMCGHRIQRAGWKSWSQFSILLGLLALLYYRIVANLTIEWWTDPNYSHGFIIPIFCGWMVWKERKRIADDPAHPNWLGFTLIVA